MSNGTHTSKKRSNTPHIYYSKINGEWLYRGQHCSDAAWVCDFMDEARNTIEGK